MPSLPPMWPLSVVLVATGGLAVRRWLLDYAQHQRSHPDRSETRLEGHRITLVVTAFGLILPLLVLLYVSAPDWVVMIAGASIAACMAGALLLSVAIGWKRGGSG